MAKWVKRVKGYSGIVGELMGFLWKQKLWWLIPALVVLLLFGLLLLFAQSTPLAPFVYTLF